MLLTIFTAISATAAHAQYATYNHDSPKQNQVTVMETGAGALTPELYYWALHNKYKKSAAIKNKLSFRTLAGANLYGQVDDAEAIDSSLVKRSEIEALNVADRQIDLAWLAEGEKIESQMERLRRNIDRIQFVGGTQDEKERWTEYYHIYKCAIDAIREAYMPNSQRKRQYLRIYDDIIRQNEILISYLGKKQNATIIDQLLDAPAMDRIPQKGSIAREAMNRWNESRFAVRGKGNSSNGQEGNDGETVDR